MTADVPFLDPDAPADRGRFDRAVVLFNAGAYYDAHEDWESLWHEAHGAERRWLQGLIQIAAAFVHWSRGHFASGFSRLICQGREKLAGYEGRTWGVDFAAFWDALHAWQEHADDVASGAATLRGAGPDTPPHLAWLPTHEPDPLPVEEVEDDGEA